MVKFIQIKITRIIGFVKKSCNDLFINLAQLADQTVPK